MLRHQTPSRAASPRISRSLALVIFSVCYFLGRYSVRTPRLLQDLPDLQVRTALESSSGSVMAPSEAPATGPAELTRLVEQSGLLDVKPPIKPGVSGNSQYTVAPFQALSWYPRIFLYPNFMDAERCEYLIRLAGSRLQPSEVELKLNDKGEKHDERTSSGTFVSPDDDPSGVVSWLEERIAAITQLPVENGEDFNILRYQTGQYYESHLDAFDPKDYGKGRSQRIATVLLILRAPEEGGETVFKKEGKGNKDKEVNDWRKCDEDGFKYRPRQGDALVFWDAHPNGELDQQALHGGCPVKRGEKWVATKWLHNQPQRTAE